MQAYLKRSEISLDLCNDDWCEDPARVCRVRAVAPVRYVEGGAELTTTAASAGTGEVYRDDEATILALFAQQKTELLDMLAAFATLNIID